MSLGLLSFFFSSYFFQVDGMHIEETTDFEVTGDGTSERWKQASWINMGQQMKDGIVADTKVKIIYSEMMKDLMIGRAAMAARV